eukprot:1478628-Amphidinium_carterae.1
MVSPFSTYHAPMLESTVTAARIEREIQSTESQASLNLLAHDARPDVVTNCCLGWDACNLLL